MNLKTRYQQNVESIYRYEALNKYMLKKLRTAFLEKNSKALNKWLSLLNQNDHEFEEGFLKKGHILVKKEKVNIFLSKQPL
ncbi:MAG: hypothetical protein ACK4J0_00600 [Candidatus Anstonellaceae archaeon]